MGSGTATPPERRQELARARLGTVEELRERGCLAGKVGSQPVCVFWADGRAYAVDDRCPHMGFPLHRGTVEDGLLTCHWHHARFDLASGGTLDPFADDVRAHDVELADGEVFVAIRAPEDPAGQLSRRLEEGLEQGLTLVIAKSVLGLLDLLGPEEGALAALRAGLDFGLANREQGWGAGLTVLTAMANVLPLLAPDDRALALVHGLSFVSRDTRGQPPRFPLSPLGAALPMERLSAWYRRFVDTRNADAAERALATAAAGGAGPEVLAGLMGCAATDHVFIDGGHTIDFINKALEMLGHVGWGSAQAVLPSLARQAAAASRSEELGEWRHPHDLWALLQRAEKALLDGSLVRGDNAFSDADTEALAWRILGDDPSAIASALDNAFVDGASAEQLARAVAYAAALRLTRFHTQNDHGDWDVVHHGFTSANATHQLVALAPGPEMQRGIYQVAMKVFLDRFLNIPPARPPGPQPGGREPVDLDGLRACWDREGMVDEAGAVVYRWVRGGGDRRAVLSALGAALLNEDAEFHWYQTYEAAARQALAWPEGSEPAAMILAGAARFLAAHTPTRRELPQVVKIAARLRRGEALYEEV
jgi:nitrite reductase/ring-hydroxylating ferredoxin subunit